MSIKKCIIHSELLVMPTYNPLVQINTDCGIEFLFEVDPNQIYFALAWTALESHRRAGQSHFPHHLSKQEEMFIILIGLWIYTKNLHHSGIFFITHL